VDIDLGTLKSEILEYLDSSDFAIFRSLAGGLDGLSVIMWDTDGWPDYRAFLDSAKKVGAKLILFASRELSEDEVDEARDEIDGMEVTREERREMEGRLNAAKRHIGDTCSLELAFSHGQQQYVYEVRPDWYDDFIDLCEEIETVFPGSDDGGDAGSDNLGGYYSNN
jgi:hypothetical protein